MTLPAPSALYGRVGRDAISPTAYAILDQFFIDLGAAYRKAVRAFADAGCRYLQLDEVFIAMLCDPSYRAAQEGRGDDPERLAEIYADMINTAMSDIPADMTITMHLCRGNFRSNFVASGGYEPVAELLFNTINVHGYFMEYDSARAGGFEPLRFVPKGKTVVLFSVPGAFTPTCDAKHLPGFVQLADQIRAKGVDTIACMAVNDVFVMNAWGKAQGVGDKVLMLADGNGEYAKALGLELDASKFGMGTRGQRFAIIVRDGVATRVEVEAPGQFKVSAAEAILANL